MLKLHQGGLIDRPTRWKFGQELQCGMGGSEKSVGKFLACLALIIRNMGAKVGRCRSSELDREDHGCFNLAANSRPSRRSLSQNSGVTSSSSSSSSASKSACSI